MSVITSVSSCRAGVGQRQSSSREAVVGGCDVLWAQWVRRGDRGGDEKGGCVCVCGGEG